MYINFWKNIFLTNKFYKIVETNDMKVLSWFMKVCDEHRILFFLSFSILYIFILILDKYLGYYANFLYVF
jgi:hypothetical protein